MVRHAADTGKDQTNVKPDMESDGHTKGCAPLDRSFRFALHAVRIESRREQRRTKAPLVYESCAEGGDRGREQVSREKGRPGRRPQGHWGRRRPSNAHTLSILAEFLGANVTVADLTLHPLPSLP